MIEMGAQPHPRDFLEGVVRDGFRPLVKPAGDADGRQDDPGNNDGQEHKGQGRRLSSLIRFRDASHSRTSASGHARCRSGERGKPGFRDQPRTVLRLAPVSSAIWREFSRGASSAGRAAEGFQSGMPCHL
jgi:hypothetical protein